MKDLKFSFDLQTLEEEYAKMREAHKAYIDIIETERLVLRKERMTDWVSIVYSIRLKEEPKEIGNITIIYDGEIWYKVYEPFRNNGYATEAVAKLVETIDREDFFLAIKFSNRASIKVAKKIGFKFKGVDGNCLIFRRKR